MTAATSYTSTMLAVSRAGHDTGRTYVVIGEDGPFLFLVNGTTRQLANPKRKKKMHVQIIRHLPDDLRKEMALIRDDSNVRKILKQYGKKDFTPENENREELNVKDRCH